mmetsp:Transcript_114/g.168  ORF Transcript_114/g.168 Transcript_114/m.168 type:complete len:208 (-) Transcript_114:672-1295(-)
MCATLGVAKKAGRERGFRGSKDHSIEHLQAKFAAMKSDVTDALTVKAVSYEDPLTERAGERVGSSLCALLYNHTFARALFLSVRVRSAGLHPRASPSHFSPRSLTLQPKVLDRDCRALVHSRLQRQVLVVPPVRAVGVGVPVQNHCSQVLVGEHVAVPIPGKLPPERSVNFCGMAAAPALKRAVGEGDEIRVLRLQHVELGPRVPLR